LGCTQAALPAGASPKLEATRLLGARITESLAPRKLAASSKRTAD